MDVAPVDGSIYVTSQGGLLWRRTVARLEGHLWLAQRLGVQTVHAAF